MPRTILRAIVTLLLCVALLAPTPVAAYSVLSHEELIDLAWDGSIAPLLRTKYPRATPAGVSWCREGDLNPQGAKHRRILSPLRLPVPPSRPVSINYHSVQQTWLAQSRGKTLGILQGADLAIGVAQA
jgi:hypothetical protein